jgi:DNA polymerase I-like protein with 3'-5' exonuclease and polymerase domains
MAGILTQSLCREIFFAGLRALDPVLKHEPNAKLVGQFHDEVVVEWEPGPMSQAELITALDVAMSSSSVVPSLPMDVEVKAARTYVK